MTKVQNPDKGTIDSLKLRIELPKLDYYDKDLLSNLLVINSDTSEIEKEFKRSSKQYHCKEYSFYASITENLRVSKDRFSDCLIILINSKQIESNYFTGITIETIKQIHYKVIELGILNCSLDVFLNGAGTDVDFKKDFKLEIDEFKELISGCAKMTKPSSNRDNGCTVFKQKDNCGIAWSVRKSSKYLTNPYLKIYHKGLEFIKPKDKGGSKEFKDTYLSNTDTTNIIRIETTVKNKRHFQSLDLGLKNFTLKDLLELNAEQINKIIAVAVNSHLLPRTKTMNFKTKRELTPTKRIYLNGLLVFTNELNYTIDRSIEILINGIENKSSKSLNKTVLKELYTDHIKDTNYDFKATKIDSIFDSIGWF